MLADNQILNLPKVSLETKDLLPEYSGIYYVLDESNVVWYIGQAKNIKKRWQGKVHHRIEQLKNQKQKYFSIYYEKIDSSQLDKREKQQINKYNPHLNNSPVKNKQVRPTETLLKETIATISDFAFILGVESPRREIKEQISLQWLIQEKILDSFTIHICLDIEKFKNIFEPQSINEHEALIKNAFNSRKVYANKWKGFPKNFPFIFHLGVNGYIVEVNYLESWIKVDNLEFTDICKQTNILGESINTVTPEALKLIKDWNPPQPYNKIRLQRIKPYNYNLIPLLFNEPINTKAAREKLYKISEEYKIGKRGLGSRSRIIKTLHQTIEQYNTNKHKEQDCNQINETRKFKPTRPIKSKPINSDFTTIDELLISRGIEPNKYYGSNVLTAKRNGQARLELYLRCFNLNPQTPFRYGTTVDGSKSPSYNPIVGILSNQKKTAASYRFDIVYLLASVEVKAWLLVEEYLQDFATAFTKLNNQEGITRKFYVSPRKFITPAKVNLKLEKMRYSAWIPFGMNEQYPTFETAKNEIKIRLNQADLPNLKLTFRREHTTK